MKTSHSRNISAGLALAMAACLLAVNAFAAERVLISAGAGSVGAILNGGFESTDNGRTYYSRWGEGGIGFEGWRNYRFPQNRVGRNDSHSPPEGKYRGIVNSVRSGAKEGNRSEPAVDTGYRIQPGDRFRLSFQHAGALGWTPDSGLRIIATLYYDDDGNDQDGVDTVIDRVEVVPRSNANEGEPYAKARNLELRATPDAVGRTARLRFQTNQEKDVYAVIDDVEFRVLTDEEAIAKVPIHSESGRLPIILTAPHGGRNGIAGVEPREGKGVRRFSRKSDLNTVKLTERLADAIERKLGRRPYVVIARFHRRYVDANRSAGEAYESSQAAAAYQAYHDAVASARKQVAERWGRGLLLDVHGQAMLPDAVIRGTQNGKTASALLETHGREALIGEQSLFGRLAEQGFRVVPPVGSEALETPGYNGGFTVRSYGSQAGGPVDAIQLELGRQLRDAKALGNTADRLAAGVAAFAKDYLPLVELADQDKVQVGVYVDAGAGPSVNDLIRALGDHNEVVVTRLTAEQIRSGRLAGMDLLALPGGSGGGQGRNLAEAGREKIRGFVREGGGLIGVCAGAYLASVHYEWSLNVLDAKVLDTRHWARGTGTVEIGLSAAGRELLHADGPQASIYYGQGPLLAPGGNPEIEDYEELASYRTEIAKNGAPKGLMIGTTAIARGRFGLGRVICFSPHPEKTEGLEHFVREAVSQVKRRPKGAD